MYPRDPRSRPERARKEFNAIGLKSTAPDGWPCWSIRRGRDGAVAYWYVLAEDVSFPDDGPCEPD